MTDRLIAVVLLLVGTACAQLQNEPSDIARRLRVRVTFGDHAPCDSSTRVELTGAMGFALAEGSVSGECTADFFDVPSGRYQVTIRGADATNADDGDVEVNSVITQDVEVRARRTEGSNLGHWASHPSFISVTELGVPANAAREFEKANRLVAKQDWAKAIEHLQKGLAIYPRYAGGYNNLGAIYYRRGDDEQARQALQQAIALDDHLRPAYVNLGGIRLLEKDYADAESLLSKAGNLEAAVNANELSWLAYAQLMNHHLDQAIQTSRQGHNTKLIQHAFLHIVAANAYEQENKISESISELDTYLAEEPIGPRAEKVKSAMATLQARIVQLSPR